MLVAFGLTIAIGLAVAMLSASSARLRIADDLAVAALVCVSGAVAGWAGVGTFTGAGSEEPLGWDALAALVGAVAMAAAAWRGRQRTFEELAAQG